MEQSDRISFGDEVREDGSGVVRYVPVSCEICPECGVRRVQAHEADCPLEQCPICGEALAHCGHRKEILGSANRP